MAFTIRLGEPEMELLWKNLISDEKDGTIDADRANLLKRLRKVFGYLTANPRHPSLQSHDIEPLSKRYGKRVWQSYLENKTPGAGRLFWVYGPDRHDITIIALEPHPADTKHGYEKIILSALPIATRIMASKRRRLKR